MSNRPEQRTPDAGSRDGDPIVPAAGRARRPDSTLGGRDAGRVRDQTAPRRQDARA
ncbi:hypothetical protein [Pseudofrankia asymbiotica]|uniref:hypothetical protein n=1 Tax=Pseudofrankia asymbiotica TaxID=1834516 RepID=UPI0013045EFF|nr:hypothetical protein [Pseudofrankia asymbiotica]